MDFGKKIWMIFVFKKYLYEKGQLKKSLLQSLKHRD